MELDFVRTFVAVVDGGQFQEAAAELGITQQAVSKRVGALERELGVRLFTRTARGARLSSDGAAFLPHARVLLDAEKSALAAVRPEKRPLRVDVLNRRTKSAQLALGFHRAFPEVELEVVTTGAELSFDAAVAAVAAGSVDAAFRGVPKRDLPGGVTSGVVDYDAHELLVGPRHPFADLPSVPIGKLVGHRIWMPGLSASMEWGAYYAELAEAFDLTIDVSGPVFGNETMLDELAVSPDLSTFVGAGSRYFWPDEYDLRRVLVVDPTPVYPMSLLWRREPAHPDVRKLRDHLVTGPEPGDGVWLPGWEQA
ncbi:LysR family transcriptional regulator [Amycolatopsis dendrobii]|uniref:LysR family transcriptional regulator n=1 Tax=Amycolatopsis dendrobii TaxID=2760662 RepID=A0A7W3Z9E4_9PSEU|nr:LysR family transcriptional regulator [Amycolatopsis dendrobii]MBB1152533.1 LysR family transcriptional regulator [Amycolatopsis dendrobii]